jgi:hypothetical protein
MRVVTAVTAVRDRQRRGEGLPAGRQGLRSTVPAVACKEAASHG